MFIQPNSWYSFSLEEPLIATVIANAIRYTVQLPYFDEGLAWLDFLIFLKKNLRRIVGLNRKTLVQTTRWVRSFQTIFLPYDFAQFIITLGMTYTPTKANKNTQPQDNFPCFSSQFSWFLIPYKESETTKVKVGNELLLFYS